MRHEEERSALVRRIEDGDTQLAELQAEREVAAGRRPRFSTGQSVHQFWAKWMPGCDVMPERLNKKVPRPSWYSGQINAPPVFERIAYGGVVQETWGYVVH